MRKYSKNSFFTFFKNTYIMSTGGYSAENSHKTEIMKANYLIVLLALVLGYWRLG